MSVRSTKKFVASVAQQSFATRILNAVEYGPASWELLFVPGEFRELAERDL